MLDNTDIRYEALAAEEEEDHARLKVDSEDEKHNGRRISVHEVIQSASRKLSNSVFATRIITARARRFFVACAGLAVFALLVSAWSRNGTGRHSSAPEIDVSYNRITKVSMLFGERSEGAYRRSIDSHRRHAQRWGYDLRVLDRDEGCGYWTKLIFLLGVLGDEMQKSVETRAEWIMWADADAALLNPNIPLSIFLPPADFDHIHFIGTKDWGGLNNGAFFVRVHPWTVSMFTSAMSYPVCHQDTDLGHNVEQEAMRLTFSRANGGTDDLGWRSGIVYMPKQWFNAYDLFQGEVREAAEEESHKLVTEFPGLHMSHLFEGKRGQLIAHLPNIDNELRQDLLNDWFDLVEHEWARQYGSLNATVGIEDLRFHEATKHWDRSISAKRSKVWTLPLGETNYQNMTTAFWDKYREGIALFEKASSATRSIAITEAALALRVSLAESMDEQEVVQGKIDTLRRLMKISA